MTVQTQRSYCDRVRRERSKSRGRTEEKSSRNSNRGSNLSRNASRSRSCSRVMKLRKKENILEWKLEIEAIKIRMEEEERLEKCV